MLNLLRRQCAPEKQRGFTLVEMIIVMALLSIVMMATMSLFIPAVRSTSVQTQVSDVQSNLRLALDRMTQDLLLAGFLVDPDDVTGPSGAAKGAIFWEGGDPTTDLTIRTRTVGNAFGRVVAYDPGKIGLSDAEMATLFPAGTKLRLFEPMTAEEFEPGVVYTVTDNATPAVIDTVTYPTLVITPNPAINVPPETVVVKIRSAADPSLQTIRYRVNDGALERFVNGTRQLLALNVASVAFAYETSATGAVKRVDVTLTGEPVSLVGGGVESSAKNRSLRTSVALRNVY